MNASANWLLSHLATIGALDPDGIHRGARLETCRAGCRRLVLVGLDADRAALVATTDPHEIDHHGELLAVTLGLRTYNLTHSFSPKGKRRWELNSRYPAHIEAPRRTAVVAQHKCGLAVPAAKTPYHSPTRKPTESTSPPF